MFSSRRIAPAIPARGDEAQRVGVMRDRLLHGEAPQIAVAGSLPIVGGLFVLSASLELLRNQLGVN